MTRPIGLIALLFLLMTAYGLPDAAAGRDAAPVTEKPKASKSSLYTEVELFADALAMVRSDYVDEVDAKKLMYSAMRGMLESLDDFSDFLEPDEYEEIKAETKGEFSGVGTEITIRDGILTVITPIVDSPAEKAGILAGDKIVKIDGVITRDIRLGEAVKKMRGKVGTDITLTIWREAENKIVDIKIVRAAVKVRSIKKAEMRGDKIGYIKLVEFQENTVRDLDQALTTLEGQGMEALILDLRNNPGGLLDGALEVAERFLPKDAVIVSTKSRSASQEMVFRSTGQVTRPAYPLIIMVNEGSASASEIVAGAVQDNRRGVVLGAKTFGKASVQTVVPLNDGSAVKLTTALYYTPSGKMIRDEGVAPDVVVAREETLTPEAEEPDIFDRLEKKDVPPSPAARDGSTLSPPAERDRQLEMAEDLLKAMKIYREKISRPAADATVQAEAGAR